MSMLSFYRSSLNREQDKAVRTQRDIATISGKISQKQRELTRSKQPAQLQRLTREIQTLLEQRAKTDKNLVDSQKKIADLSAKILREEQAEQKKRDAQQAKIDRENERARRSMQSSIDTASAQVGALHERVSGIEAELLLRVRVEVISDETPRERDIYLVFASPDEMLAKELYGELTAHDLDVWFSKHNLTLGKSQSRQMDRGIASSRIGVVLITKEFLEGRYWAEREIGALLSTHRNVIPVLSGVKFEDLAEYSPFLADIAGLKITRGQRLPQVAALIAETLKENSDGHDTSI